jgi:hypothetical protein
MHDHIMGLLFKQGQKKHLAQFEQRGKAINEKVRLYADVGNALIKAKQEAADPYQALEAVLLMARSSCRPFRKRAPWPGPPTLITWTCSTITIRTSASMHRSY